MTVPPRSATTRLKHTLDSIEQRDGVLRAVHQVAPGAREEARCRDERASRKASRDVLYGSPVLIKDNIDVAGTTNTAGSLALKNNVSEQDAFVVERLRDAGMVVAGKTELSEWAAFVSHSATPGANAWGQTQNAVDPTHTPGGSSSGSAVAVAAGYVRGALGTETLGSIVGPAALNGTVGLKPSVGMLSRTGVILISESHDTPGVLADSVGYAARMLQVMAVEDPADSRTQLGSARACDLLSGLQPDALKGVRVGVERGRYADQDAGTQQVYESALDVLRSAGAILVPVEVALSRQISQAYDDLLLFEGKDAIDAYLGTRSIPGSPRSLAELMAFNRDNPGEVARRFGQSLLIEAAATHGTSSYQYEQLRRAVDRIHDTGVEAAMRQANVDVIVAPTTGPAQQRDPSPALTTRPYRSFAPPAAIAGIPHVTVPMGTVGGMPVGLSLVGVRDDRVLAYAFAFEQRHRQAQAVNPSMFQA